MLSELIINLDAIRFNIEQIRSHLPKKTRIMAILKANAYGIGCPTALAKFLIECGVDIFGFDFIDEAIELREDGIKEDLFVIMPHVDEFRKAIDYNLQVAISNRQTLDAYDKAGPMKVHLNINTGMNRLGCPFDEATELAQQIMLSKNLNLEGIMSHLPSAEDPNHDSFTISQVKKTIAIMATFKEMGIRFNYSHIGNSAGALRFLQPEFNMVRLGLIMYGVHPSIETSKLLSLQPALTLCARIVALNRLNKGDTVSYGRTYKAKKNHELIAVVPLGYFDGLHRCYSNRATVLVKGQKAKIVGNICMDFMMLDVSHIPGIQTGELVTVFGQDEEGNYQSPEEFARSGKTIPHELITCLGPRMKRTFIKNSATISDRVLSSLGNLPLKLNQRDMNFSI